MVERYTKKRHLELLDYYLAEVKAREALEQKISELQHKLLDQRKVNNEQFQKLMLIHEVLSDQITADFIERLKDHYYGE